jgi:hypothetical protein
MNSKFKLFLGLGLGLTLFTISGNTQAIPTFTSINLEAMHSGKCLHIDSGTRPNNYPVTQWSCGNQNNVLWTAIRSNVNPDYYAIASLSSYNNKCLRVKNSSSAQYAEIVQYDCNAGFEALKWSIIPVRDNYYYIKNKYTGKCLHVHDASQLNGAKITQRTCENRPNILWKGKSVSPR